MPATENFSMPAGDSMELTFTVESEDDDFDLTDVGTEVRWWFAPSVWYGADQASGKKDNGLIGGIAIVDATHFTVVLVPADTDALHGSYYHEAEVELPGGGTFTVTVGVMTITRTLVR
jgi:hypothetical protein